MMEYGGWSDTRMVKRYAHLAPDYLRNPADKLSKEHLSTIIANDVMDYKNRDTVVKSCEDESICSTFSSQFKINSDDCENNNSQLY